MTNYRLEAQALAKRHKHETLEDYFGRITNALWLAHKNGRRDAQDDVRRALGVEAREMGVLHVEGW